LQVDIFFEPLDKNSDKNRQIGTPISSGGDYNLPSRAASKQKLCLSESGPGRTPSGTKRKRPRT
jgi:hypothetical protein